MFQMYDVIRLKQELPEKNLPIGALGTILLIYEQPSLETYYEVEFTDGNGNALAILALPEEEIEKVEF